ncbi:MAG TPA: signal recognition particle protein [Bacillota bacterium]
MFESLSERLQATFKRLRGRGKLGPNDVKEATREVRMALLEADVNYRVAKDFIARIDERAVGAEVLESLTPAQQVIKIVHDELIELMGKTPARLNLAAKPPTVIMLVGLQGSGKTTTAGKLAAHLRSGGRRPLLVAADVYRPAAVEQLKILGDQLGMPVWAGAPGEDPVAIAEAGCQEADRQARDAVIVDTAGRLHVDEELMTELVRMKEAVKPHEVMLVVDAMSGQSAVDVAEAFNTRVGLDGVILTKMDSDARGGAALSVRAVTGRPIKFIGTGEKLQALEPFYPDRMASRILGMGDVLTLIEKAQENFDEKKARDLERKLRADEFTFEDFVDQLRQVRKMGPIDQLMSMFPGAARMKGMIPKDVDDRQLDRAEAIINSMTPEERRRPELIDGSRRRRIAAGSGTSVQQVNTLLKQFDATRKMIRQVMSMGEKGIKRGPGGPGWMPR